MNNTQISHQAADRHRTARTPRRRWRGIVTAVLCVFALGVVVASPVGAVEQSARPRGAYVRTNLVSDVPGAAQQLDPNLVNAWGMASGPATPVWVSAADSGVATIYPGATGSTPVSVAQLVVSIPGGSPTGQVFNTTGGFDITPGQPALFIFASESGHITAWNMASGTSAVTKASTPDAVYKGLALAESSTGPHLYASNFHAGTIDVFDSSFMPVTVPGGFTDPNLPAGYAPFNVQEIGGSLYVTYAQQDADAKDDVAGAGHGFVDVFTPDGALVHRLVSQGRLNSPWGLALAPSDFGPFSGALLVGNFGNGRIHAYDPATGRYLGILTDGGSRGIRIDGLWGLRFGNGITGNTNTLLFTAGPKDESHGLFGSIEPAA
ncbi:MAG: TIGR03118 family protein [Acidimicrobiales bacterium]